MTQRPTIRIVRVAGLEALYVDGTLRAESKERIDLDDVLAALGLDPVFLLQADAGWFREIGYFPNNIKQVGFKSDHEHFEFS